MRLAVTEDPGVWSDWCRSLGVEDVYCDLAYTRIWADEEGGRAIGLRYDGAAGTVLYPLIEQPLDSLPAGGGLVDWRTAYDFGGPRVVAEDAAAALREFAPALASLAAERAVVTEFARLHPFRCPVPPAGSRLHAHNYYVDLSRGVAEATAHYHPSFRRNLRRAARHEVRTEVLRRPPAEVVARFVQLYSATMQRVGADPTYLFSPRTFERLLQRPEIELAVARVEGRIAAGLCLLRSAGDLFYFLGASDPELLPARPNHALFDHAVRHGVACGLQRFHLGGGPPGVRRLKAQLTSRTVPYYVLRRVHRPKEYERIAAACGVRGPLFPAYRLALRQRLGGLAAAG